MAVTSLSTSLIQSPWMIESDYAIVPTGTTNHYHSSDGSPTISFPITCDEKTSVQFSIEHLSSDGNSNSVWVSFNSENSTQFYLSYLYPTDFVWQNRSNQGLILEYNSVKGSNVLMIHLREDGTKIRSVRFVKGYPTCAFDQCSNSLYF